MPSEELRLCGLDAKQVFGETMALIASRGYKLTGKCYYFHGGRHVERLAFELPL